MTERHHVTAAVYALRLGAHRREYESLRESVRFESGWNQLALFSTSDYVSTRSYCAAAGRVIPYSFPSAVFAITAIHRHSFLSVRCTL